MKFYLSTIIVMAFFAVQQLNAQQKSEEKNTNPRVVVVFGEGFIDKEKIIISAEDEKAKDSVYYNESLKRPLGTENINEYQIPFPSDLSRRVKIVLPQRKQTIEYEFYLRNAIIILLQVSGSKVIPTIADHPVIID